jgi:phage recombination protein Bet
MSTALIEAPAAPLVTTDQLALVKTTVAAGATDAELKLYLYDCARQGVLPLDLLIHFTKRGGKYTPITSIDFMRTRAADTGEYAGSDDAVFGFEGKPDDKLTATVSVYRLVQGHVCKFTATARWSEYCPGQGQDHMWRKMPHTMLAKCAEALALRKGFPRQLAGLYAKEEMEQAGPSVGYSVEAPIPPAPLPAVAGSAAPSVPNGGDSGVLTIKDVRSEPTKKAGVTRYTVTFSTGEWATTIREQLASLAQQLCQDGSPVEAETKATKWGTDLMGLHRAESRASDDNGDPGIDELTGPPLTEDEIPF